MSARALAGVGATTVVCLTNEWLVGAEVKASAAEQASALQLLADSRCAAQPWVVSALHPV